MSKLFIPRRRRKDIDLVMSVQQFVRRSVRPVVRMSVGPSVTNLLGLNLKDNYRFEHETSEVYISY